MGSTRLFVMILFLAAGLVLLITWLLLEPEADIHDGLEPSVETEAVRKGGGEAPRELAFEIDDSEIERIAPSNAPRPKTAEKPYEKRSPSGKIALNGTITVVDEFGIPHAEESGTFRLLQWEEHEGGGYSRISSSISVDRGTWSAEVSPKRLIGIGQVMLGGKKAFYDGERMFPVPENAFLELKVRRPGRILLHVRASDSKTELDKIELITGLPWERDINEHPGSYGTRNVVFRSARSPITLEPESNEYGSNRKHYFARCPGYAWNRIEIDLHNGGEYFLYLDPACGLDVSIFGFDDHTHAVLRLRKEKDPPEEPHIPEEWKGKLEEPLPGEMQDDYRTLYGGDPPKTFREYMNLMKIRSRWRGTPVLERDIVKNGRIAVDCLSAGTYLVSAEIGYWFRNPKRLAEGEVEIQAGRRASLALMVQPVSRTAVPLKGIVIIPSAWNLEKPSMSINLLDTPLDGGKYHNYLSRSDFNLVAGRVDAFQWDAGLVQPGRYEIKVNPAHYSIGLTVGSQGMTDAVIEVPPPARIAIRVIDKATGAEADVDSIYWHFVHPKGVTGGGLEQVKMNRTTGLFEFDAPVGLVLVRPNSDRYRIPDDTGEFPLEVRPGVNSYTIEAEALSGFILIVKDGDRILPWNMDWDVFPELAGRKGFREFYIGLMSHPEGRKISVAWPGRYTFEMPRIPGYLPVPEQEVLVKEGEFIRHIIHLKREL